MKRRSVLLASALVLPGAAQAATYLPTGPQTNVAISTVVEGGWTQWFVQTYDSIGPDISSVLDGCQGSRLMLAGRAAGSETLLLLAQAEFADVTFDTGINTDEVHAANGTNWYFNPNYSWGFADISQAVFKVSCDASGVFNGDTANADLRLCWHTGGGGLTGGWRVGENAFLNSSADFERVIFFANDVDAVPEPATWATMLVGFAFTGFSLRGRKQQKRVRFAF